ncbi:MAG: amidohydrolase/deacetylase family metallohydrolase [Bacteroidia bacterium]|nr:amidohydrolase/deacetylase family metallohydrolase [Bacteroidia bacterium]
MKKILLFTVLFLTFLALNAQEIDLLIKGGHVIDPKNNIDQIMDVAITDGKILQVAKDIPAANAKKVVDAKGLYVTPGLIDIHTHNFWGTEEDRYLRNSFTALPPDGFTLRAGVTTVADAGSPGWRNFLTYKNQTIDKSKTRVLVFLNIVGDGMSGGPREQDLADMDPKLTAMVAKQYPEHIVGIKLAHYVGHEWTPAERAVEAGKLANIPVMVDFGSAQPPLSIEKLYMEVFRPGDIFTHCYGHVGGREAVVDDNGKLRPFVLEAQKKGIIFDVGHGGGSFTWEQAVPGVKQGFKPNSISTDLHTGSMNGGMKDMINVMSKFLALGLSVQEVIKLSTWNPAQIIHRPELGNLSPGAPADVAVINLQKGAFGYIDVRGLRYNGDSKLVCELTVREGEIVYDLNGLASPMYKP